MKKYFEISYGQKIDTVDGSITILSHCSGSPVEVESFILNDDNDLVLSPVNLMTGYEICHAVNELNGTNYNAIRFNEESPTSFCIKEEYDDRFSHGETLPPSYRVDCFEVRSLASGWECTETEVLDMLDMSGNVRNWDAIVSAMDDEIREELHNSLCGCTQSYFLDIYCDEHKDKYGEDFLSCYGFC